MPDRDALSGPPFRTVKRFSRIKRQVFYSFHFDNDVMRVQQIRQMGVIDGDEPVSANEWEKLRKTDGGIERWIDDNMAYRSCVIVLVGEETADRPWVKYEIKKAWNDKKGLLGIYIHNLKDPKKGTCNQGKNPFAQYTVNGVALSSLVKCYNPKSSDAYNDIKSNIDAWVEAAIASRKG
jgi:hypothetical protein